MLWSGKIALSPQKVLSILIDNDISPDISKALGLFGFDIKHVQDIPQFNNSNRPEGVGDPEIIQWCKDNGYLWITHDKTAKRQHDPLLKRNRIYVLWIRGKTGKFATWQQFKIIVRVIDRLKTVYLSSRGAMHFQAGIKGTSNPKVIWTELPQDMSRKQNHIE